MLFFIYLILFIFVLTFLINIFIRNVWGDNVCAAAMSIETVILTSFGFLLVYWGFIQGISITLLILFSIWLLYMLFDQIKNVARYIKR